MFEQFSATSFRTRTMANNTSTVTTVSSAKQTALANFRTVYNKIMGDVVVSGTEDSTMTALRMKVLRGGSIRDMYDRARKYMPILLAWNAVLKARIEAEKAP